MSPDNALQRMREQCGVMSQVRVFMKAHGVALRTIVLSVILAYALYAYLYFHWIWRNKTAHHVGAMVFFGSFPWSLLWFIGVEPYISKSAPGYAITVAQLLAVGIGAGINLAILVGVTWFIGTRARSWHLRRAKRGTWSSAEANR